MGFWKKARDIHLEPTKFFGEVDGEGFGAPSKFAATVGLVFAGLIAVLGLMAVLFSEMAALNLAFITVLLLIIFPVTLVFSAFFQAAMVHLAVYIFGERGFSKTYNAVAYPVSAVLLWGWIPILNFLAGIYSIYLQTKGIETLHDMEFGRALICVIWPIILSLVLTIILVAFIFLLGFGFALA
ncbi:MAG: YIP1 family protein [Candidatus Nanohalobium sp.]